MDIQPAEYIPTEEEQEIIDFEEKLERGQAKPFDTPIKMYFDNHSELYFDPCALDYIINVAKIKTIGELTEKYFNILPDILSEYPFLNQEDVLNHHEETINTIIEDVCEPETIMLGANR